MIMYKVTAKYQKGPESALEDFESLPAAQAFIQSKLREDINLKVNVTYQIYDLGEMIATYDQSHAMPESDSGNGQTSTQRFSPNPLQTNLRPNLPPSSYINDDDKHDEK